MFRSLSFRLVGGSLAGFLVSVIMAWFLLGGLLESHLADQLDESLKTEALDVAAALDEFAPFQNIAGMTEVLERYGHTHGIDKMLFRFYDSEGVLLAQSDPEYWGNLNTAPDTEKVGSQFFTWKTYQTPNRPGGVRAVFFNNPDGFILQIGKDRAEMIAFLKQGRLVFAGTMAFIVILGSLLGWMVIHRPIRDIASVASAAHDITEKMDFEPRVMGGSGSLETDRLARAFNTMLDKIQHLIQSQKEIMDNIAHDIRSPVARMRGAAESSLNDREDQALAGHVIEDCDHILNLVNILLDISATESGLVHLEPSDHNLGEMLEEALELFQPLFEMKQLTCKSQLDGNCVLKADGKMLQRLLANLLDNAVKYNVEGGKVEVKLEKGQTNAVLTIRDTGMGISEEALPRIFDRFYRGDASRTEPGNGLGLSFCKAAVTAMQGRISCSSGPGGTIFVIHLPISP